jgi:hypothetical protein
MTNENDWVTQDVVPRRVAIDEYRWIGKNGCRTSWGMTLISPKHKEDISHGYLDGQGARLEVRCKRKDHPVLGKVGSRMVSQHELNAAPRTRAWTFGTPAQTGHFLFSYKDPAIEPQEISAVTLDNRTTFAGTAWFIYLGQTSDFADPVVPKAKYTLMMDPNEPRAKWLRRPDEIQDRLNAGWRIVIEQECEVPEWDR